MDNLTGYEFMWLFLSYSFLGWILETVFATIKERKVVNRGLINGPFCIIYGISAVLISTTLHELTGIWLILFAAIYASVVEWFGGHLVEKIYHEKWWDYSDIKWNFEGYVCVPMAAVWGVLGYIVVKFGDSLLLDLYKLFPELLMHIILWIITGCLIADIVFSSIIIKFEGKGVDKIIEANNKFTEISLRLEKWIAKRINLRIDKAYPKSSKVEKKEKDKSVFARGCDFYKIALLFFIGSFLGDVTETIFCRVTAGVWMRRSSVIWGQFSIVWGLAIAIVTAMLYKYREKSDSFLFIMGTCLGGAYEYLCSVFTEIVFGKIFWDYSKIPFNLGGRINLLYCFFWGMAAVIWFKTCYPKLSDLIEKIPVKPGKICTWLLILFMSVDVVATCMVLHRYEQRENGIVATKQWQMWIDENYNDARMEKIYPNAKNAN